ncbi:hypothetical protein PG984_005943 [Apiospora sp. TS-2023a]
MAPSARYTKAKIIVNRPQSKAFAYHLRKGARKSMRGCNLRVWEAAEKSVKLQQRLVESFNAGSLTDQAGKDLSEIPVSPPRQGSGSSTFSGWAASSL